ncbi:hypothetical protein CFOL_v3_03146 [Cephalotus follicularis]|uniref:Tf2-1-like SH3-like domain-containing protein n=1 Tax=Cephalotus follicularis TaxID=3775 RepID=A0A1Q3AVB0_CEPFO|nr:hypothetical protein CFOL_v3_03146 [Cephalotus follicularis]
MHVQVHKQIIKQNEQYKRRVDKHCKRVVFKEGDLVWIHLRRERFPVGRFGKLKPRADGPFKVLQRINDNAYKIELPGEYNVSGTFNVANLSPYYDDEADSRVNLSQGGVDDAKSESAVFGNMDYRSMGSSVSE